jgi:hypothetical protein
MQTRSQKAVRSTPRVKIGKAETSKKTGPTPPASVSKKTAKSKAKAKSTSKNESDQEETQNSEEIKAENMKQEVEAEPMDVSGSAEAKESTTRGKFLEKGHIYFFYRPVIVLITDFNSRKCKLIKSNPGNRFRDCIYC